MKRLRLYFTQPGQIDIREEPMPEPTAGEALVATILSGISSGTELLIYRGQFPAELDLDDSLPSLAGGFAYPTQYGYASVGRVIAAGKGLDPRWEGRLVFSFHPHESHFSVPEGELIPIPGGVTPEEAVFLPNMETAVNLVLDGAPLIGERVVVFGQGVVGLLTTYLLAQFPLDQLVTLDSYELRRQASLSLGAHASLDPADSGSLKTLLARFPRGADLVYELSGSPTALDQAVRVSGFAARVVVGSWYGTKRANLDLGGHFHRSRMHLVSSQVSTIAPNLSGRWTKARRFSAAWSTITKLQPAQLITHRFPLSQAHEAYRMLDEEPANSLQVVLTY